MRRKGGEMLFGAFDMLSSCVDNACLVSTKASYCCSILDEI